ncbi:MAG: methyltransferase [Muribaculum sp.]|nr:methyltransferase [Muribaculum sp.]
MGTNKNRQHTFRFKQFAVANRLAAMKVGTDGVLLGAWCDVTGCTRVLDVGTGSGVIALMVAQRCQQAMITGIDIVPEAVAEARENAAVSPWGDRLDFVEGDFSEAVGSGILSRYDLIVSNPPFFMTDIKSPDRARAAARHGDGLSYAGILRAARNLLAPGGRLALVSPADRENDIMLDCELSGLNVTRLTRVYTKPSAPSPSRLLWEIAVEPSPVVADSLIIGSDDYNTLLRDFYLAL